MLPLISIIIPVFNHAHTLKRCLEGIGAQEYRPLEVILVNDGSTDNFEMIAATTAATVPRRVINAKHRGASAARNLGLRAARGKYVIFWDADTVGKPGLLVSMHAALAAHPEASYAYSQFKFGWKKMTSQPFSAADLKRYNYIDTTSLIRRPALRGIIGPFDENLTRFQDWDLWLTLLEQKKTGVFLPQVLYTKVVRGRAGISRWLPRFAYRLPGRIRPIEEYRRAREIVLKKHGW